MLIIKQSSLIIKRASSKLLPLFHMHQTSPTLYNNPTMGYPYSQAKKVSLQADNHTSKQQKDESQTQCSSMKQFIEAIRKDTQSYFVGYQSIRQRFADYLGKGRFKKQNQHVLVEIIYQLSKYPSFPLHNDQLLAFYKIVCFNMHLTSVQSLNKVFLFLLIAQPNISQSPIYHEFIKFYLHVPLEEIRVKYQLDLDKLSVIAAIKQFIARATQRGFFPRTPPYTRNLNIIYLEDILSRLASRPETIDALMIKKINYTIFMDIKVFYQQEMKQNLYHPRKTELMSKFTHEFMQVLSKQIELIHHESTHLRQLYMKLYLTLPEDEQLNEEKQVRRKEKLYELRFKNVIYLYRLGRMHITRMDHYKLEEISENIGVVIEFIQQVEKNFRSLALQHLSYSVDKFSIPQTFHILDLLQIMRLTQSTLYQQLVHRVFAFLNPYTFATYFKLVFHMLQASSEKQLLLGLIENPKQLSNLNLSHLHQLSSLITSEQHHKFITLLFENTLAKLLGTDFQVIGGEELVQFLQIYSKNKVIKLRDIKLSQLGSQNSQMLRIFIMRYLADHHKQFKIVPLQAIINQLLELQDYEVVNFDDQGGNYPSNIWQEMEVYLTKVEMLFSQDIQQQLKSRRNSKLAKTN